MSIRQTLLLVIFFVMAGVTLVVLDNNHTLDPMKTGLHDAVEPAVSWINDLVGNDSPTSDLEVRYQQVEEERDEALARVAELELEVEAYEDLNRVFDVQLANPEETYLPAKVLNYDPSGIQELIVIDKGSNDGIEVGMAVVDPHYFVGLVTSVEETTSRVTLAIDDNSAIGAKLLDSKGVGIVYGRWRAGGRMELEHVDRSITPGDEEVVVTSDGPNARTAKVPSGLIIGRVTGEPELDNQGDSQSIEVLPAADFDNLSTVAVIIPEPFDE